MKLPADNYQRFDYSNFFVLHKVFYIFDSILLTKFSGFMIYFTELEFNEQSELKLMVEFNCKILASIVANLTTNIIMWRLMRDRFI